MVKTPAQSAERYRLGIVTFGGAEQYIICGKEKSKGFLAVAKCLEDAKKTRLIIDMMVTKHKKPMVAKYKKPTSENIKEIVRSLGAITNEDSRFERLTATKDVLGLVHGDAEVYEMAVNMLTGNNRLIFEIGCEDNIDKRYDILRQKLCELNELQFPVTINILYPLQYCMLLRERCESCNDSAACLVLDNIVNGNPDADDGIFRLGLLGLWQIEDNRPSGAILVILGAITEEEFKRAKEERDATKKLKEGSPQH